MMLEFRIFMPRAHASQTKVDRPNVNCYVGLCGDEVVWFEARDRATIFASRLEAQEVVRAYALTGAVVIAAEAK